jgi:dienelactone hydrolase
MCASVTALVGDTPGVLLTPARLSGLGVLVLTGSSGRVDVDRARLFADRGALAMALQWWGGVGQAAGINEAPVEIFVRGIDRLRAEGCDRIAVMGVSYGAVAALLTAVHDPRVDVAVAISPSAVVWQNEGPGLDGSAWPPRSSFSWRDEPLPFVVWDPRAWPPAGTRNPVYRPMFERSLKTFAEDVPAATIPVEHARAEIILVAGGADALWPSRASARQIADRLQRHGKTPLLIEHPDAGHSPIFPDETPRAAPPERAWGGSPDADRELGALAWDRVASRLGLTDRPGAGVRNPGQTGS